MATLIGCWTRMVKRRALTSAAVVATCLLAVLALAAIPFRGRLEPRRPRASVIDFEPVDGASTGSIPRNETAQKAADPTFAPKETLNLGSLTAGRALAGVAQLALTIPETSAAVSKRPAEDANSELLREHFARLQSGRKQFARLAGYTATMVKQEKIDAALSEEVTFELKVRHQPFSVYLKWESGEESGKELLFVDGANDSQLLVRLGGFKGRILPALKIDPYGSNAMRQSRYPITKVGILALCDTLIERRELEMREKIVPHFEKKTDASVGGRPCTIYVSVCSDPARSPVYRKSVQYIDNQWNVPLRVVNYTWPEAGQHLEGRALDEATLIEYYMYSDIVADARLTDRDFDRANPEYHFHR